MKKEHLQPFPAKHQRECGNSFLCGNGAQPRQPIQALFIQFYVFAQGCPQFAGKCLHFSLNNVHYFLHIQERVCNLEKELRIPQNSSQAPLKQSLQRGRELHSGSAGKSSFSFALPTKQRQDFKEEAIGRKA